MSEQILKPPIGLMPKWLWIEWRIAAIDEAIMRYKTARLIIPTEWLLERDDHLNWLKLNLPNSPLFKKSEKPCIISDLNRQTIVRPITDEPPASNFTINTKK